MATMTDSPVYCLPSAHSRNGRSEKSTFSMSTSTKRVPKRSACSRNFCISSGPWMPSGKPG